MRQWLYNPLNVASLGLVRIGVGLILICWYVLIWPQRVVWFTQFGLFPTEAIDAVGGSMMPDPLRGGAVLDAEFFLLLGILSAVMLVLGWKCRLAAGLCWLCQVVLQARDWVPFNGSDTLLRILSFYLMVTPCNAYSLDRRLRRLPQTFVASGWSVRLFQVQMSAIYLQAFLSKLGGSHWIDGTALHYVLGMHDFQRFPYPAFLRFPLPICLLSYGTLAVEFSIAFLIWLPAARRYVLLSAICLHAGIEYMLNIPLFGAVMLAGLASFATVDDLALIRASALRRFQPVHWRTLRNRRVADRAYRSAH